jgi:serine/threonine-protein kinase
MDTRSRVLAGRYRLEELIGRGGMSTVYRATDTLLGRTVAVKVLLEGLADEDPTYVARFEREARAAAGLANSAVVTVYDTGIDEETRFIVMEYVSGSSLAAILRDEQPLAVDEALRIGSRVASALGAAHGAGVLHRDIKPANVMIAEDGTVKVLDFGIARKLDGTTLTQVASVVGTAAYMSPERALGQPGDARADVYSLGCLLYAMLSGRPPFGGDLAAVVLHQQINAEPRPPGGLREGIPAALDALVLAMLAKSPEGRPGTAGEVRDRLDAVRSSGPEPAAAPAPTEPTARLERTAPTSVIGPPPRSDHRRRAIIAAVVTAALALAVIALASGGSSPHRAATSNSRQRSPVSTTATVATTRAAPPSTTATRPAVPQTTPTPPAGGAHGHGGNPPGKAKKHGGKGGDGGD